MNLSFHCWSCGKFHNRAIEKSGDRSKQPQPGDLTICNRCLAVSRFTEGNVEPVNEAMLSAEDQADVNEARHALRHNPLIPRDSAGWSGDTLSTSDEVKTDATADSVATRRGDLETQTPNSEQPQSDRLHKQT